MANTASTVISFVIFFGICGCCFFVVYVLPCILIASVVFCVCCAARAAGRSKYKDIKHTKDTKTSPLQTQPQHVQPQRVVNPMVHPQSVPGGSVVIRRVISGTGQQTVSVLNQPRVMNMNPNSIVSVGPGGQMIRSIPQQQIYQNPMTAPRIMVQNPNMVRTQPQMMPGQRIVQNPSLLSVGASTKPSKSFSKIIQILKELEMEEYEKNFRDKKVIYKDLLEMGIEDLKHVIPGPEGKFPRKRLFNHLKQLQNTQLAKQKKVKKTGKKWELDKNMIKFGNLLQSGAFGVVRDGKLSIGVAEIDIAIKEIATKTPDEVKLVTHEIEIMSRLDHENVLKCFGGYIEGKSSFIVMELCHKGDLYDFKKKNLNKETRIKFMYQIGKGMKYLHEKKIVHRDLKTQNILLTKDNTCKICDFGASKNQASVNQTFCGTVEYLASEQFDVSLLKDPKYVDIYSFGIMVWIHNENIRPELEKCKDMPIELQELMSSCWARVPTDRPESFGLICEDLKEIFKGVKRKKKRK